MRFFCAQLFPSLGSPGSPDAVMKSSGFSMFFWVFWIEWFLVLEHTADWKRNKLPQHGMSEASVFSGDRAKRSTHPEKTASAELFTPLVLL